MNSEYGLGHCLEVAKRQAAKFYASFYIVRLPYGYAVWDYNDDRYPVVAKVDQFGGINRIGNPFATRIGGLA